MDNESPFNNTVPFPIDHTPAERPVKVVAVATSMMALVVDSRGRMFSLRYNNGVPRWEQLPELPPFKG